MKFLSLIFLFIGLSFNMFSQGETCDNAEEITINNTYTADGPSSGNGCNTCPGGTANADWYKFTPAADAAISISSCIDGIDTHFFVYDGSCNNLNQVAANDDGGCGLGSNYASYAEFSVSAGTEYYIEWVDHWSTADFNWIIETIVCPIPVSLGFSNLTDQGASINWISSNVGVAYELEYGPFGFTPGEGTVASGTVDALAMSVTLSGLSNNTNYEVYLTELCDGGNVSPGSHINFVTFDELVSNDVCSSAIDISCGDVLNGTTVNATIDYNAPLCAGDEIDGNGVWYHFTGVDGMIKMSTCGAVNFDTRLFVYEGDCGDLNCIAANDEDINCDDFASSVHFPSQVGHDYYILVHGFEGEDGSFPLTVTCDDACLVVPSNGSCSTSEAITPGASCNFISTTNECASINFVNPNCSPFAETQDIWYSFNSGSNTTMSIDLELGVAESMGFSIYDACGDDPILCQDEISEMVSFSVVENTEYFIQFWSTFDEAGTFNFCLSTESCVGPTSVTTSSTVSSEVDVNWISVNSQYTIEYGEAGFTQGEGTFIVGSIGTDGPPVTISGLTNGLLYELYIHEQCTSGDVVAGPISFSPIGFAPDNDECVNATVIDPCGSETIGSTIDATNDANSPDCSGVSNMSSGVWYVMDVQEGYSYVVGTCNDANFDTKVTVYSGSCDALECVAANDDVAICSNGSSQVSFTGQDGTFWILVHGFDSSEGNFVLTSSCYNGIEELVNSNNVSIYPNPSNGVVNIKLNGADWDKNTKVLVYNVQGQEVYSDYVNTKNGDVQGIDLGQLSKGIYTLTLIDTDQTVSKRLILK